MLRTLGISILMFANTGLGLAQKAASIKPTDASWNDNGLIAIQQQGGDPSAPGNVKIAYYGHDAFKITSPAGLTVLTDPWRNDPTGFYGKWFVADFPPIPVDIVVSTHAHFDHDAVEAPRGLMVLERIVGNFNLGDVSLLGLADKHQCLGPLHHKWDRASADFHIETCSPANVESFDNAVQVIATGGLRIAIWGDNRSKITPSLDRYLNDLDVLILPIDDSETILTHAEVDAIVERYKPKAVIPAHYLIDGLTTDVSGLRSADGWLMEQREVHHAEVLEVDGAELMLNSSILKSAHGRVYYFGNHYLTK